MGYEVKIDECRKDLTAKERIAIKDTTNAVKLDEATKEGTVNIVPEYYAILKIHNDKVADDYLNYLIVDKDGTKYVTGSNSFWSSFMNIYAEMINENDDWSIDVYRCPSKNYKGKDFITCSIA